MRAMIAYKSQSCVTGKLLRQALSVPRKRTQKLARLDYFLRWGNSDSFPVRAKVELNTAQAVANATNKLRMLQLLKAAEIPVPEFFTEGTPSTEVYIRDRAGVTRFGSDFSPSADQYFSLPIENKRREYRVHVFNSEIVSIYEKIPRESGELPKLFKAHNCKFSRVNPENSRCDEVGQKIAIDAVNALGLLFGGVDLIRTRDGKFVVSEVNSAPGLNSSNIQRWVDKITQYVQTKLGEV